jgi:RND family efflux transporter MFP subunit
MMTRKKSPFASWVVLLLVVAAAAGGGYLYRDLLRGTKVGGWLGLKELAASKDVYYCPMHPNYKANKPGECPICNMALVKLETKEEPAPQQKSAALPAAKPAGERKILYWQDPMNPAHRSDKPGKAPDGMDLVPVYADEAATGEGLPPGTVAISAQKQQLIGVQIGEVRVEPLSRTIRTVGQITLDETRIIRIQTKVEGWIEQVFMDFSGKWVKKGQPLISLYSPEMVSTQQELLIARRALDTLGSSSFPEIAANSRALYESTRQRLRLWDISEGQIKEIEKRGTPIKSLTLASPMDGFVIARNAFRGQRVTPEMELYSIADLSTIWVMADVYEYEVPMIRVGQAAAMTFSYFPGQTFKGKVTYIYPQLDNQTRTLKVRLEFPNPEFKLKPEMYANVELSIDYGRQLALPDSAVLDSGTEQIVFVVRDAGHFEPRKVQLGARVDDRFIVLSGLAAGEQVVTSGNFLVDSESQLKAAMGGIGGAGHAGHGAAAPAVSEPQDRGAQPGKAPAGAPTDQPQHQTPAGDHAQHGAPAMDHSQQPAPGMDPSRHQAKPPENDHKGHDHSGHGKP